MKKRLERVVALCLSASLLCSYVMLSPNDTGTTGASYKTNANVQEPSKNQESGKVTPLSMENVAAADEDDTIIEDVESGVDYDAIIQEISDEAYRESVEIRENTFVVVRREDENTQPIEKESWYDKTGAIANEVIFEQENVVSYRITTEEEDIWSVVDYTNALDEVEIAEPEYVYYLSDSGVPSEENNEGMEKQWYLNDQQITDVWGNSETYGNATGEGVVVAVIDTGVDYTHEDLQNNMWINTAELGGTEGVDDDGNGYVDDIYGINLIDSAETPSDDHGHGTHVAGIIAMEDNETGGVGIAYRAQIMAIKAGGADGTLNSSDIAKAVTYAYRNGADVINMSFGSYAHSAIVESALQDAFSSSVLVAAAGNDAYPTLDAPTTLKGNMYPAAYSYVIGVMAYDSNQQLASFSNWDYKQNYGAEYEVAAPGVGIYSTLPGNRYASWNGTSMAAPMVSAVAAVLRSSMPDKNKYPSRLIMGQIVSATDDQITFVSPVGNSYEYSKLSLKDALVNTPKPNISVDEVYVFDSTNISDTNNGDGIIQPGEVLDIAVGLRNQWGAAGEAYVTVNATSEGGVDNPYVTFLTDKEVAIDEIGSFGTQNNGFVYDENSVVVGVSNPIRVKIAENAPNDLNIEFHINYHAKNALDHNDATVYKQLLDTSYVVSVVKGTVLEGKIASDMTLSADEYYIVKNSLLIPKGVTVKVEPGTQIQFWGSDQSTVYGDDYIAYIQVQGNMYFNGTKEAPIDLFPGKDFESYRVQVETSGNGVITMDYVNITNPYLTITSGSHLYCVQDYDSISYREINSSLGTVENCIGNAMIKADTLAYSKISNIRGTSSYTMAYVYGKFDTVLFDNCQISYDKIEAVNCTFLNNQGRSEDPYTGTLQYFSSNMKNVGNEYMTPQYETVSKIHTVNGKKYVVYKFDNYYFQSYWDGQGNHYDRSYENYRAVEQALAAGGGHIAAFDVENDEAMKQLMKDLYEELREEKGSSFLYYMAGFYYDTDRQEVTATNGADIVANCTVTKSNPLSYYYSCMGQTSAYNEETGTYDTVETSLTWLTSCSSMDQQWYIIAEYPEDTSDYNVKNPVFSLEQLGTLENTKFTNNAILNRLTSTDTSNWMKVTSSNTNVYTYQLTGNYWGTTDKTLIQKQLIDFDTNIRYADIVTAPELETPDEKTYPCVSNIYITDKNGEKVTTLGNGEYTVHVLFNRDMDQTVNPMVTYGPDDPYTDYTVSGAWQSAREWVGTATVKVLINQGQQYFRVKDAAAADDSWLTTGTDWARFGFIIEATGAEALTLQGEGVRGGIYLNWTQDEYDTMAGFNVYRSGTGETGSYKRVNSSIVSSSEKAYTDTKVSSGKKYYYYFTVVDTDMTESRPSNIISCASLDDELPTINHTALKTLTNGMNATVTATIRDNVGVNSAVLHYRMQGESAYKQAVMTNTSGNTYSVQISAKEISVGTLEYYIAAADSVGYAYAGSDAQPYTVAVESSAVITSVKAENAQVGKEITGVIKGLNFTTEDQVRFEGKLVDTKYVSDTELTFTCTPTYMGKKKIEIMEGTGVAASLNNAFSVTDSSIKIYNEDATIVKNKTNYQKAYFYSNFAGKLESLEITYEYQTGNIDCYPAGGNWSDSDWKSNENTVTRSFTLNSEVSAGSLFYMQVYDYSDDSLPTVSSVKINGIEVENLDIDSARLNIIDKSAYIPVDEVKVEESNITLEVGESFTPNIMVAPGNATMQNTITYSYDSSYLQKNEDGSFTALRSGNLNLGITCDEKYTNINVYVAPIPITAIKAEKTSYTGTVGSTITINVTAEPLESDASLSWGCNDYTYTEIPSINDNGRTAMVRLKKAGDTTVFVTGQNAAGEKVTCYISLEIVENTAYVDVQEDMLTAYPNQILSVNAAIKNSAADDDMKIKWSSSNTAVAKVDESGRITTVGNGYAIVTASVENGAKTDSVIILVGSDSMSYTLGDINMDGKISSTDAMLALKMSLAEQVSGAVLKVADVNGDGKVSSADAMLILQYVTGVITQF